MILAERLVRLLQEILHGLEGDVERRRLQLAAEEQELRQNSVEVLKTSLEQIAHRCHILVRERARLARQSLASDGIRFGSQAQLAVGNEINSATWATISNAVKTKVPALLEASQKDFRENAQVGINVLRRVHHEAGSVFTAEFNRRYTALRALAGTVSIPDVAATSTLGASDHVSDATRFVARSDAVVAVRGAGGTATGAAIGAVIGFGLPGALIGGAIGGVIGLAFRSNLGEHQRKIIGLLEPGIQKYVAECIAHEQERLRLAEKQIDESLLELVRTHYRTYAKTVERMLAEHKARQSALGEMKQMVENDAREIHRRSRSLDQTREALLRVL